MDDVMIVGCGCNERAAHLAHLMAELASTDSCIELVVAERPQPVEFPFELLRVDVPEISPRFHEKPPRRSGQKYNRWA